MGSWIWVFLILVCLCGMLWDFSTSVWGYLSMFRALPTPGENLLSFSLSHFAIVFLASIPSLLILGFDYITFHSGRVEKSFKSPLFVGWIVWKLWDFYTTYAGTAVFFMPNLSRGIVDLFVVLDDLTFNQMVALFFPSVVISACSISIPFFVEELGKSLGD